LAKVLQGCGVSQLPKSTFVLTDPIEIVGSLVGLKEVRVLAYERWGPRVELMIEQVVGEIRCPACAQRARIKERPVVHYVDLPVYGTPMSRAWKKHRIATTVSVIVVALSLGCHRL
jgi:transposase